MSEARYLSLVEDPPTGFRLVTTLARRELRRWPFALYTGDFAAVEARFGLLFDKLIGVIITKSTADQGGTGLDSRRLGPGLWAFVVSEALLPQLQNLVRPHLEMLESLRAAREEHRQVVTQLDRTRVDRARLAEYFATTQARSRIDIREHARWMVDALGALARLGGEVSPPSSSALVDQALALLIREPFRYRGAALVEMQGKSWRLLQDAGHRPSLENLQPLTSATVQIGRLAQVPLPATRHGAPRALVVWRPDTAADFSMVEMSFFRLFAALLSTVPASSGDPSLSPA